MNFYIAFLEKVDRIKSNEFCLRFMFFTFLIELFLDHSIIFPCRSKQDLYKLTQEDIETMRLIYTSKTKFFSKTKF